VPQRDIEKLQVVVDQRQGTLDAATASKQSAIVRISTVLPAEKATAEAALAQAQVDLDKTFIRAGGDGRVEQFLLRPGDVITTFTRAAGVLIPEGAGRGGLQAGFGQIEGQVMKVGMVAEATCISKPWVIIPMVVTNVQDYIAAGQFRGGERLIEAQDAARPGTILAFLEPLYKGGLDGLTPGSSCIVNAYTSNHEEISKKETSTVRAIARTSSMPSACSASTYKGIVGQARSVRLASSPCPSEWRGVVRCRSACGAGPARQARHPLRRRNLDGGVPVLHPGRG